MDDRLKKIHDHYVPRLGPDRPHHDILDWFAPQTQQARFQVLVDRIALEGRSLLDVGCGLGDLAAYLAARGVRADYTGVDVIEEFLARARGANPGRRFECLDIFAQTPAETLAALGRDRRFDVVFSSGALNLNLGNHEQFLPHALATLAGLAGEFTVVNFLHARYPLDDPVTYVSHHPEPILAILRPLCESVDLVDDYLDNDFTVIGRMR